MNGILTNQYYNDTALQEKADTVLNNTNKLIKELVSEKPKRYGYRIKITESDPEARIEYIYDAQGMTPAKMTTNGFDYGSWKNIWFIKNNYPCMLKYNGMVDYKLNPNNYAERLNQDGTINTTTASDYNNISYEGNAMAAIPLCWVKRYQDDVYQYVIFCETQYDESYKAYAHTNKNGDIVPYIYHAMFEGVQNPANETANKQIRSIAGLCPQRYSSYSQEKEWIALNNTDTAEYHMRSWSCQNLIADLLTLISKTSNSQAAFGTGNINGYHDAVQGKNGRHGLNLTGETIPHGQFVGVISDTDVLSSMRVFHIENFWGNRWDRIEGLIQKNGKIFAKMTPEGNGYSDKGEDYAFVCDISLNQSLGTNAYYNGFQVNTLQNEFGRFPLPLYNGSDKSYETDYFWIRYYHQHGGYDNTLALCGGACCDGWGCGSRCLTLAEAPSWTYWSFGASLLLIPNR